VRKFRGFTLTELLVAMAVVGVILLVLSVFFSFQARTSRDVQGSNELNVRVRSIADLLVKDLQLVGGQAVVVGGEPAYVLYVRTQCESGTSETYDGCVTIDSTIDPATYTVSMYYASSLWSDDQCRNVTYFFDDAAEKLHRADVPCGAPPPTSPTSWSFETLFAQNITRFSLAFECAKPVIPNPDGPLKSVTKDPTLCYDNGSYVRTGTVTVEGVSRGPQATPKTMSLATNMPNVRNPMDFGGIQ